LRLASRLDNGKEMRDVFSAVAALASIDDRTDADWLSCNGSDIAGSENISQLQTTRRDYHAINIRGLVSETTYDHLRRSLFEQWDYSDPIAGVSLHLEPREDRRHAYQWHMPSGDPTRKSMGGMMGANRLALEAWPLFQSLPFNEKLITVGFRGTKANNTRFSWPIWSTPITVAVLRSVLSLSDIQQKDLSDQRLAPLGIEVVFGCRRILVGKTPNLTSPVAVSS
jgi:CRISPR-associated endonuclease/helicase Cas3